MVAVLDTNHFTELVRDTSLGQRLRDRLSDRQVNAFTTIVNAQEIAAGWCALINQQAAGESQVKAYAQFQHSLELIMELALLPFDAASAALFHELLPTHRHIGTMDLKIAAICMTHDALLLSRNMLDFQKVAGLRVENWLDSP
jgi:tRNA(fMet)-specific endonuclease VapC